MAAGPEAASHEATPPKAALPSQLSLSDVVERSGVPASTIHHYRRAGLIPPPQRVAPNRFCYGQDHVDALGLVRLLRERRGMSLDQIASVMPGLLARPEEERGDEVDGDPAEFGPDARRRLVGAAIQLFSMHSFAEVTISQIAQAAGLAKGSVYRHFASKEELFEAVVHELVDGSADRFGDAVRELGGSEGLALEREKAASVFARLIAEAMPILLELARAAKGHPPSELLARQILRTLAEAAGQPLTDNPEDVIPAGLGVLEIAFATVLHWAISPDWPEGAEFGPGDRS